MPASCPVTDLTCPRCQTRISAPTSGSCCCHQCGLVFDPSQPPTDHGSPPATPAATTSPVSIQVGDLIDGYRLTSELGSGGMSTVYRAERDDEPAVALKLLHAHLALVPEQRRRFDREIASLADLDHPRVLGVLDHGVHHDRPYLVSRLVGERSLRHELAPGQLPPARVAALMHDLAEALVHIHQRGMVHRDLKPENIILDDQGRPHLVDFGIVQRSAGLDQSTLTSLTRTDMVVGTLAYMAPEQAAADDVDHRADLYALGAVAYEALTGHRPVGRFENPSTVLGALPPAQRDAWDRLLLGLLERDPDRRPRDASATLGMIAQLSDEPLVTPAVIAEPSAATAASSSQIHISIPPVLSVGIAVNSNAEEPPPAQPTHTGLRRDGNHQILGGLCAGLARWTGVHVGWWRVGALLLAFSGVGLLPLLIAYLVGVITVPQADGPYHPAPLNRGLPQRRDGWAFGVCSLLAERTTMPAWIWRTGFVIGSWTGLIAVYLLLAAVLPRAPQSAPPSASATNGDEPTTGAQAAEQQAHDQAEQPAANQRVIRFWAAAAAVTGLAALLLHLRQALFGPEVTALIPYAWITASAFLLAALFARPAHDGRPWSSTSGGLALGAITVGILSLGLAAGGRGALAVDLMTLAMSIGLLATGLGTLTANRSVTSLVWGGMLGLFVASLVVSGLGTIAAAGAWPVWLPSVLADGIPVPGRPSPTVAVFIGLGSSLLGLACMHHALQPRQRRFGIIGIVEAMAALAVLTIGLAAISPSPLLNLQRLATLEFTGVSPLLLVTAGGALLAMASLVYHGSRPKGLSWPVALAVLALLPVAFNHSGIGWWWLAVVAGLALTRLAMGRSQERGIGWPLTTILVIAVVVVIPRHSEQRSATTLSSDLSHVIDRRGDDVMIPVRELRAPVQLELTLPDRGRRLVTFGTDRLTFVADNTQTELQFVYALDNVIDTQERVWEATWLDHIVVSQRHGTLTSQRTVAVAWDQDTVQLPHGYTLRVLDADDQR